MYLQVKSRHVEEISESGEAGCGPWEVICMTFPTRRLLNERSNWL